MLLSKRSSLTVFKVPVAFTFYKLDAQSWFVPYIQYKFFWQIFQRFILFYIWWHVTGSKEISFKMYIKKQYWKKHHKCYDIWGSKIFKFLVRCTHIMILVFCNTLGPKNEAIWLILYFVWDSTFPLISQCT